MNSLRERGATAVIVAGSLLLVMGIAAVAIDGGQAFSERRQAQTAVDFAAMAALQGAASCPANCTVSAAAVVGATEAQAVVAENLPGRALDWASCADPSRPSRFVRVAASTACVSFTANFDESRVVLPPDTVDTSFGGVVGQETIDVDALAQAGQRFESSANVVPFAFGGGTHTCLFSNQAPQTVGPCNGPRNGNFGYLDITQFGNDSLTPPTPQSCGNTALSRLPWNIAVGTDHVLGIKTPANAIVNDRDACPNLSETPNQIEVQTGSPTAQITSGLVTSVSPSGRLRCASGPCRSVRAVQVDDTPLWTFLTGSHGCGVVNSRDAMINCLSAWNPGKGVIFTAGISTSRRFVAVPQFSAYPSGGFGYYEISAFIPVYLDTIYASCNANRCDTVFSPGAGTPATTCPTPLNSTVTSCGLTGNWSGGTRIEGLTALTLDSRMLPDSVREDFAGAAGVRVYDLTQ